MAELTLRPDQIADLAFLINNPKAPHLSDPGTGKTPTACMFTKYALDHQGVQTCWVQPLSIIKKNQRELIRWTGLPEDRVVIVEGTKEQRAQIMRRGADVFLMSAEGFGKEWEFLVEHNPRVRNWIGDEFHLKYRGHTARRTQSWYIAMRKFWGCVPMTGTVVKGKLASAYPILHAIAPKYYGSYEHFLAFHAVHDDYGKVMAWRNHDRLEKIFKAIGIRRSFAEVHGAEAKVVITEECEMTKDQRRAYDEFAAMGILETDDGFLESKNGGVAAMRLRQIMACPEALGIHVPDGRTGKDERLWVHIEDALQSGEPLAIFGRFIPEVERIYKQLQDVGARVGLIHGGIPGGQRAETDEKFVDGRLQFVVCTADTAGIGFNWGHVDTVVFTTINGDDDSFVQAYRRFIRGARAKPLRIYVLFYEDSKDTKDFEALDAKSKNAHLVQDTKEVLTLAKQVRPKARPGGFTMENFMK
jgi:hypothetical protein